MLSWLNRRRDDSSLVEVEAVTLIVQHGLDAYSKARQRQQDAEKSDAFAHWGRVAQAVAERTGRRIALIPGTQKIINGERGHSPFATGDGFGAPHNAKRDSSGAECR